MTPPWAELYFILKKLFLIFWIYDPVNLFQFVNHELFEMLKSYTLISLITYKGLFLTLALIRLIYSPIIPIQINCTPPRNKTTSIKDAQPGTTLLNINLE